MNPVLQLSPKITLLPIIHGSGDFALEVRRVLLTGNFDCVAVPLPPSFQRPVEEAIAGLPAPTMVVDQRGPKGFSSPQWRPEGSSSDEDSEEFDDESPLSYVPIDPCQGVIMALRIALGEHLAREFVDLETNPFEPATAILPDPYALKRVPIEKFAAAILPAIPPLPPGQPRDRVQQMAGRLRELEGKYRSILMICSIVDWPWIRDAYLEGAVAERQEVNQEDEPHIVEPHAKNLAFLFGELPYITGLYEQAREELANDENLSVDGVKELLLAARDAYRADFKGRARKITPFLLSQCLKYIRNLSLLDNRMTPDLYTLILASKQIAGDGYALHVAETANEYPFPAWTNYERVDLGIDKVRFADGTVSPIVSRLPGPPFSWRSLELKRKPDRLEREKWQTRWNPYQQCSWPPEDHLIENFRQHVFDRAQQILGADLVRTEKFTTSVQDGIDIRDTLRNWHTGDIYVKVMPPARGKLDCVVMLFDSPAEPRDYPWRTTWYAEHQEESTLAFFATDFRKELVGPGICLATYGGAMFLFPPVAIPDIWSDENLDFCETLEERLIAAGCLYGRAGQVALLSSLPPGAGWRRLAKRFGKRLVHVPLSGFSDSTIQQLRMVHVLNGQQVRSYAADFIRKA